MSRMVALADISGIYRALLKLATPELIAPRLPRIQARYMDFGDVLVGAVGRGRADATRTGHPRILAHWYVAVINGFMPAVLEASGAKSPRIRWHAPMPDGEMHGLETVAIKFEATWG